MTPRVHHVFVTGGTGYLGSRLILQLLSRGHQVRAVARSGSEQKLPPGCDIVIGDVLRPGSFDERVAPADTFVHLVGVSHPNPSKADQFRAVDLASVSASVPAAGAAGVKHFVYVSVARPAPVMKAYLAVRAECEALICESRMNATLLRPWYVLGPGHRWPYALIPMYRLFEILPATREAALRLGLVTLHQMVAALVWAVEHPCEGVRVMDVARIRELGTTIK